MCFFFSSPRKVVKFLFILFWEWDGGGMVEGRGRIRYKGGNTEKGLREEEKKHFLPKYLLASKPRSNSYSG